MTIHTTVELPKEELYKKNITAQYRNIYFIGMMIQNS